MTSNSEDRGTTRQARKPQTERERRLAAALRANLRRRKDQARQRDAGGLEGDKEPEKGSS